MTDEEPVEKASKLMGVNYCLNKTKTKGGKSLYRLYVSGGNAAGWMMTIYRFMSPRRAKKIQECLTVWKNMPGRGYNQYKRPVNKRN